MRNMSFYTNTYLQTRMDMYEKSLKEKESREESYEERLFKLQQERSKLLREYTKFREIEEYSTSVRQSMKDTTTNIVTAGTTVASGGKSGAGRKVDINSYQKNVSEYALVVEELAEEYGIQPGQAANIVDQKIAGQMVESIVERFKEGKVGDAVAQARVLNNDLKEMDSTTRTKIVGAYNALLDNHQIPENFKLLPSSEDNPQLNQLTELPAGLAARGPAIKQSIEETTRREIERGLTTNIQTERTEYDPEIKGQIKSDLDRIAKDMQHTQDVLDASRANKLEFELGPGYRPFAGMFRTARSMRGRVQAMQGMDNDQREVFGIIYDYVNQGKPKIANTAAAYEVASKIDAGSAGELLAAARGSVPPGSGLTVSDIVQAYAQIKMTQNAGKSTPGELVADEVEMQDVNALARLNGEVGQPDDPGLKAAEAAILMSDNSAFEKLEETLSGQQTTKEEDEAVQDAMR